MWIGGSSWYMVSRNKPGQGLEDARGPYATPLNRSDQLYKKKNIRGDCAEWVYSVSPQYESCYNMHQ